MILERRKWMIGLAISGTGTLVLLITAIEAILSVSGTLDVAGALLVIQGLGGLLAVIGGFATMVAGTDESSPWSDGNHQCPHCKADLAPSARSCHRCDHRLDDQIAVRT